MSDVRVLKLPPSTCIEWQGKINMQGYGIVGKTSRNSEAFAAGVRKGDKSSTPVHRLALGVTNTLRAVHHMCRNKLCMRRAHLLDLTQTEHQRLHYWMRKI